MIRVIGLLGAKGSGKDTLAKLLINRLGFVRLSFADALYREVSEAYGVSTAFLENRKTKEKPLWKLRLANCKDLNFVEVALLVLHSGRCRSGWLGRLLNRGLSRMIRFLDMHLPRSPRWTLQVWGTEYRRGGKYGYDAYWIDKVRPVIEANREARYVITDVRFLNEAKMVRECNGILLRVRRPALEEREAAARKAGVQTAWHRSETELAKYPVDAEALNREGNPEALLESLEALLPELARAA